MSEILEIIMLVCFGFSWPINLYHNYRSRTAKGMSPSFILLIMFGYVAGIMSKIMNGNFTFVLVVYLLNLVIVSLNLVVYFRNLKLDHNIKEAVLK